MGECPSQHHFPEPFPYLVSLKVHFLLYSKQEVPQLGRKCLRVNFVHSSRFSDFMKCGLLILFMKQESSYFGIRLRTLLIGGETMQMNVCSWFIMFNEINV